MPWKLILAGVKSSPEGLWAALVTDRIARDCGARCVLVHAVRDVWSPPASRTVAVDVEPYRRVVLEQARQTVARLVARHTPDAQAWPIEIRGGRPSRVLCDVAREQRAELVVIGADRDAPRSHWRTGRTAREASRLLDTPLLVAAAPLMRFRRVLAAVDLSLAAGPTIAEAETIAHLDDAALRFLHVIEPPPFAAEFPLHHPGADALAARDVEALEQSVWPLITLGRAERVVRRGQARLAIVHEALEWKADLVVVGSHGRGWTDRLVLGSVSEGVLSDLPCSVLVVAVHERLAAGLAATGTEAASPGGR